MKKALSVVAILALALAVSLPAVAEESEKEVKLTGWITDQWCGAKNANAAGADCARACAEKGSALVLFSDGKLYGLSDQTLAKEHIGHKVLVKGTIEEESKVMEQHQAAMAANAAMERTQGRVVHSGGTYTRNMQKVGRNEPCPCGSGKKFKKCHSGKLEELATLLASQGQGVGASPGSV